MLFDKNYTVQYRLNVKWCLYVECMWALWQAVFTFDPHLQISAINYRYLSN